VWWSIFSFADPINPKLFKTFCPDYLSFSKITPSPTFFCDENNIVVVKVRKYLLKKFPSVKIK